MKKIFSLLVALVILMALCAPALAYDGPYVLAETVSTTVTVVVANSRTASGHLDFATAHDDPVVLIPTFLKWTVTVSNVTTTGFDFTATYTGPKAQKTVTIDFEVYVPMYPRG